MFMSRLSIVTLATALAIAGLADSAQAAASDPKLSPCRPVPVAKTHGKGFEANCRLAYIDHGTVPCVTIDAAKPRTCRFTSSSGAWLQSTTGARYAMAGQRISPRGKPGGRFVIASRSSLKDPPPCMQDPNHKVARTSDAAGTSTSYTLPGSCIIEVALSANNASGKQMDNYATKTVCSSTHDSYDQRSAMFMGSPEPGVWCYSGEGAGLNDINGTERDYWNNYLPGMDRCHVGMSNGWEVYAAKRPATTGWPVRVDTHSPIVWRPVAKNVSIAN